jgi:hypothetical protein
VLALRGSRRPCDRVSVANSAANLVELFSDDISDHAGLVCSIVQIGRPAESESDTDYHSARKIS